MIGCGKVGVQQLSYEVVTAEGLSVIMCQKVFMFVGKRKSNYISVMSSEMCVDYRGVTIHFNPFQQRFNSYHKVSLD